jgi:hypothetical protein
MKSVKKGKFKLSRDGDFYDLSESGFHVVSIHRDDLADVVLLFTLVEADRQGLEIVEIEASRQGVEVRNE